MRRSKELKNFLRPLPLLTTLIFLFAAFTLFYNLGGQYLQDWDEAIYVKAAADALHDHDYLALKFRDGIFWDKTPIPLFPMMILFKLFGVSEVTARLSSAFFGAGTVLQIFLIARRYYGQWTGVLAVLITVTITQLMFWHGLRSADIDSITLFFLSGAISSWILVERVDRKIVFTMVSLSLAFLCKGPIIGIPVVVILSSLLVHNPLSRRSLKPLALGFFIAAAIVLPWYLYMYHRFGNDFVNNHVIRVFFQWFAVGVGPHVRDDMFLLDTVLLSPEHFPWFGAAVISVIYFLKLFSTEKRFSHFVLIAWVFTAFFVVNQSQTKIQWYVFPLYLPLAIMVAKTLVDFVENRDYLNTLAYYVGLMVILSYFFNKQVFPHNTTSNVARAGMAALALYGIVRLIERYVPHCRKILGIALICLLFYVPLKTAYKYTRSESTPPVFEIAESLDLDKVIYTYDVYPSGIYYLTRRGTVRDFYVYSGDIKPLRGQHVLTRTEILNNAKAKKADGSFQVAVGGEQYLFSPVKVRSEFSIVKVD